MKKVILILCCFLSLVASSTETKTQKNKASEGTAGNPKETYASELIKAVHARLGIPPEMQGKKLKTTVMVQLSQEGRVKSSKVTKKSKDPQFDAIALKAIEDAQPLPLPDDPAILDGATIFEIMSD